MVAGEGLAQLGRVFRGLGEGGDEVHVGLNGRVLKGGGALLKLGRASRFAELAVDLLESVARVRGAAESGGDIWVSRSGARGRTGGGAGVGEGSKEEEEGGGQHIETDSALDSFKARNARGGRGMRIEILLTDTGSYINISIAPDSFLRNNAAHNAVVSIHLPASTPHGS